MMYKLVLSGMLFLLSPHSLPASEIQSQTFLSKDYSNKSHGFRGPRGHRGHKGKVGFQGAPLARIYASAYCQIANGAPLINVATSAAFPLNQVESASGIDTSQLVSNNALIIQNDGDYLIQYSVVAALNFVAPGTEISLTKNGTVIPGSRVPFFSGAVAGAPSNIPIAGAIMLPLKAGDQIKIINNTTTFGLVTLPSGLRAASICIEKIN
jgi:hypothetical protein